MPRYETIQQCQGEAYFVQDACNPSGVAHSLSSVIQTHIAHGVIGPKLMEAPAIVLFVNKLYSLFHFGYLLSETPAEISADAFQEALIALPEMIVREHRAAAGTAALCNSMTIAAAVTALWNAIAANEIDAYSIAYEQCQRDAH